MQAILSIPGKRQTLGGNMGCPTSFLTVGNYPGCSVQAGRKIHLGGGLVPLAKLGSVSSRLGTSGRVEQTVTTLHGAGQRRGF